MAYLRPNDDFYLELRERHVAAEQLLHSPEPPYQYAQLGSRQIRLLEVLPDDLKSHRIFCRIHQYAMSDLPGYEALSYTWGTGSKNRWIVVITEGGFFHRLDIKENLFSALWRLRHDFKSRLLWVDAICINQTNMAERSSQVRIMREIYTKSLGVVIWLGEKSGNSEGALDLVQTINEVKEYDAMNGISRLLLTQHPRDDRLPSANRKIWHDFFNLLKRPWFKRAWIVQELATAPNASIVCGTRQLRWDEFHSAVLYVLEIAGMGLLAAGLALHEIQLLTNLDQIRRNFQNGHQFNALEILLYSTHSLATDRRDHIFAFHGLLHPGSQDSFMTTPEYRAELSSDGTESPEFIEECVELYTKRAIMLLENRQNLDLLSVTSVTRKSALSRMPTWVPDWSASGESECFLFRRFLSDFKAEQRPKYRASGDSSYTLRHDGRKLLLKGHAIDNVSLVSEVLTPLSDELDGLSLLFPLALIYHTIQLERRLTSSELVGNFTKAFLTTEKYHTGEDRRDVYWQTLLGGLDGFMEDAVSKLKDKGNVRILTQFENLPDLMDCDNVQDRANSKEYKLAEALFYSWYRKRFSIRILAMLRLDWAPFLPLLVLWMVFSFLYEIVFGWPSPSTNNVVSNLFPLIASKLAHRRVLRTEEGLVGLAAHLAIPGDTVVLCEGGKLPLIIRKRGQEWELIGECYVHGLMHGGKWDELEREREIKGGHMSSFWIV